MILIYLRARYYDPSNGPFISRDPIVTITQTPYAYVVDSPLNGADPSGLIWTGVCIGGNVGFVLGITGQYCLGIVTRNGGEGFDPLNDIALTHTYGGGGQTPYVGGGISIDVSNADYTDEQSGWFAYLGGGGRCLAGANATVYAGHGRAGRQIVGGNLGAGPGLGLDVHGGGTNTDVTTPQSFINDVRSAIRFAQAAFNLFATL